MGMALTTITILEPEPQPQDTRGTADNELVRRVQAGDRGAFDELYRRSCGRVYAVCLRMSEDAQTAERLTQDAFVRAWQHMHTFRGDSAFTSWLHRLTVNVVLEDRRSSARRLLRIENVADPELYERASSATTRPGERIDLERAIARLPLRARTVLILFDIEGYSQDEIARLTGTAVGTVKAQLHRARKLLREMLNK